MTDFTSTPEAVELVAKAYWPGGFDTDPNLLPPLWRQTTLRAIAAFVEAEAFELWWGIQDRDDPDDFCRWGSNPQDLANIRARPEFADLPVAYQIRSPWRKR